MSSSGPPRSAFALAGGPGFLIALLLLACVAAGALYLTGSGKLRPGGASLSLPGTLGNGQGQPSQPAQPPKDTALESLQPLAEQPVSEAAAPDPIADRPVITEDLSPLDLLVRYTPDPVIALADTGAEGSRRFRRPAAIAAGVQPIGLVATGLGLDRAETAQAILSLPPEVSLSFAAASPDLADWIDAARAYGHEALVGLALGAVEGAEAGETALLAELGPAENLRRLEAVLARAPKAAGVTVMVSDDFLRNAAALTPILARLQQAGMIVLGLPVTAPLTVAPDKILAAPLPAEDVAREALAAKALARQRGAALILGAAANVVALADGLRGDLARSGSADFALVPASALVEN